MRLINKFLIIIYFLLCSNYLYADNEINSYKQECFSSLDESDTLDELIKIMEVSIPSENYDLLKKIKWKYTSKNTSFIARAYYSNDTYIIELHKNIMKIFCGITPDLIQFYTMQSNDDSIKKIFGFNDDSDENILGLNFNNKLNIPVQTFLLKSGWKECLNSNFSENKCSVFYKDTIKQFIYKKDYKQYEKMLNSFQGISKITTSSIIFVLLHEFAHHALGHTKDVKENILSLQDIRKKEYEADSYARLSLYRGNLENISTAFSFDLFSTIDFVPQSTIKKMNYTNKFTHDSAECRGTRVTIEAFRNIIIDKLFEDMIKIVNKEYILKKEIIDLHKKMLQNTKSYMQYIHILAESSRYINCNFDEDINSTKLINEYSTLINLINSIMHLSYQKNYQEIVAVLANSIKKDNEFSKLTKFAVVHHSTNLVRSFYRTNINTENKALDKIETKISSSVLGNFFSKIYNEIGSLDVITTSRILDSLLEYTLSSKSETIDEKIIRIEKYAILAIKYNPNLTQSYIYLANIELYNKNKDKALEYYSFAYKTANTKQVKNLIRKNILNIEANPNKLREHSIFKDISDNTKVKSIKNNDGKNKEKAVQLLIPNETKTKFPTLVKMIINSKSLNDTERNYWFNAIPMMKKNKLDELFSILKTEKKKLDEINFKYSTRSSQNDINQIFGKVQDKGIIDDNVMDELIHRITYINELTDFSYNKYLEKFESIKGRVKSKYKYYQLLSSFYLEMKMYDNSLNNAEESTKINPKNYRVYYNMGKAYQGKKEYNNAVIFYKKAVDLNSKDENLYNDFGSLYFLIHKYDKSLYYYNEAIKINPNNAKFYYNTGRVYSDITKQYKKAIEVLNKSMKMNPDNTNTISLLANTYSKVEEYSKALLLCQKSLKIDPKNSYSYSVMSNIYLSKKNYIKAIEVYRNYFKVNPDDFSISTDFFELQLIQGMSFDKKIEKKYISIFKDNKEKFINYEMLKILEKIIFRNKVDLISWKEKYKDTKSNWNFSILEGWVNTIQDKNERKKLFEALIVFKKNNSIKYTVHEN